LIYDGKGQKRLEFLSKAEDILPADIPPEYFAAPCFLVAPIDYEAGEELLRHLGESGKMVSAEISGFGGASSAKQRGDSPEEKAKYLRKITPHFRIVKAGAEDCKCLFGPGNDEKAMAEKFLDWGAQIAVITRGERGVLIASRSAPGRPAEIIELPAFRTQAVDCTGAGDVWHAGFLYEYLKNNRLEQAGRFANALSSIVIEKSGGVTPDRFPDAKEVYERMRT
jgi:sugar/nucleoside kinase (ribokinase family)